MLKVPSKANDNSVLGSNISESIPRIT